MKALIYFLRWELIVFIKRFIKNAFLKQYIDIFNKGRLLNDKLLILYFSFSDLVLVTSLSETQKKARSLCLYECFNVCLASILIIHTIHLFILFLRENGIEKFKISYLRFLKLSIISRSSDGMKILFLHWIWKYFIKKCSRMSLKLSMNSKC